VQVQDRSFLGARDHRGAVHTGTVVLGPIDLQRPGSGHGMVRESHSLDPAIVVGQWRPPGDLYKRGQLLWIEGLQHALDASLERASLRAIDGSDTSS
jgi:hypothetical protein